eukprot:403364496
MSLKINATTNNQVNDYDVVMEDYDTNRDQNKPIVEKSSYNAKGSRYFQVEPGYDRKIYENDWKNRIVLTFAFIAFYTPCIFYWWGLVSFGLSFPEEAKWYSVGCFVFAVLWLLGMLLSGYRANKKLHRWEFYMEKINDMQQILRDKEQREIQKREQEKRINQAEENAKSSSTHNKVRILSSAHSLNADEQQFEMEDKGSGNQLSFEDIIKNDKFQ